MSNTGENTAAVPYIAKINGLVADGREDLIAAIIADYERGAESVEGRDHVADE